MRGFMPRKTDNPAGPLDGPGRRTGFPCVSFTVFLALLSLLLPSCAIKKESELLRADVNELKLSAFEMKKDLDVLKTSRASGEESLKAVRESQSSLYAQVSALEKDVQFLRGRVDENRYLFEKTVEKDVSEIMSLKARLEKLETSISELSKSVSSWAASLEEMKKSSDPSKPYETKSPQEAYENAQELFRAEKYSEARAAFESFIRNFPENELAGNAQFWVAETYFSEKDFVSAILEYENVLKKYKQNRKVPAAILKQAFAFDEIGEKKASSALLKELIEKYPDSDEAKTAEARLKKTQPEEKTKEPPASPKTPAAQTPKPK